VFFTDNEISTAALLVVGAFFGAVTVLGYWTRLRLGDNEFDPAFRALVPPSRLRNVL
jgi:hypothetical protein